MTATILAVWFLLRFTVPPNDIGSPDGSISPLANYQFSRGNARQGWQPANIYRDPMNLSLGPPVPHAEGGHADSGYVSVTADPNNALGWRNGGTCFRMVTIDASGNVSEPSNIVVIATALPDTNFTDGRDWIRGGQTGGIARFQWAPGDTDLTAFGVAGPLVPQEAVQVATRPVLCHDFGYWMLRGARQACP